MKSSVFHAADLFCGAGGTSAGLLDACDRLDRVISLTAINHWERAVATHSANHPEARHRVACLDSLNPRSLFTQGSLDLLWASPECTHHSTARGGKPINEQSRATAWCVTRWADALLPDAILIENVPEFTTWGPLGPDRKPITGRKGEIFQAWKASLESIGYEVDHRKLCSADYGDPTTRTRLFVQAVRRDSGLRIVWPYPTHSQFPDHGLRPWRTVRDCIDWSIPGTSIFDRPRPLKESTLRRCLAGLRRQGCTPALLCMEHGGRIKPIDLPAPTVTTAKGGAFALIEPLIVKLRGSSAAHIQAAAKSVDRPADTLTSGGLHLGLAEFTIHTAHGTGNRVKPIDLPAGTVCGNRGDLALITPYVLGQQSGGSPRPVDLPAPTVAAGGAISLIEPIAVQLHSMPIRVDAIARIGGDTYPLVRHNGIHHLLCTMDGQPILVGILFRMLDVHELAAIQGFPRDYRFTGTKTEQVKQIGNAVTRRLARALALALMNQDPDIASILYPRPILAA